MFEHAIRFLTPVITAGRLLFALLVSLLIVLLILSEPASAASAVASSSTQVDFRAFLNEALQAMAAALLTVLTAAVLLGWKLVEQHFGLKDDSVVRNAMLQIADDAVHYALALTGKRIDEIGPVNAGSTVVADALRFFLAHAGGEIAHFNLSEADGRRIVTAAAGRLLSFAALPLASLSEKGAST